MSNRAKCGLFLCPHCKKHIKIEVEPIIHFKQMEDNGFIEYEDSAIGCKKDG